MTLMKLIQAAQQGFWISPQRVVAVQTPAVKKEVTLLNIEKILVIYNFEKQVY